MPSARMSRDEFFTKLAPRDRTRTLAEWHWLLLDRLAGSEAEDRLDRLIAHPALSGPELNFVAAKVARQRDDVETARRLIRDRVRELPGHQGFRAFVAEIGAETGMALEGI